MLPALSPGERVLFDRLAYVVDEPTVGDIVLARHAARAGVRMIKRVARGEGLGPDEYWLLGDNAEESTDSRTFGAVSPGGYLGAGMGGVLAGGDGFG